MDDLSLPWVRAIYIECNGHYLRICVRADFQPKTNLAHAIYNVHVYCM